MGNRIHGFVAWFLWKQYYLSTLPSAEKTFRIIDRIDIFLRNKNMPEEFLDNVPKKFQTLKN